MTNIILNKEKKIEYELNEKIGEGQYGEVYRGINCTTKEVVAIKKMKFMKTVDKALAEKEVQLMKVLKHKNILRYIDDFRMSGVWYIVLEYCAKGDLQKYKQKVGKLPEFHCKALIRGVLEALVELHSERVELGKKKIAHRDLKPANILISSNNDLKLADFGFSKDFSEGWMKSFIGSPVTMAPEILNRKNYTQKCDVWSLGVITFYLLFNQWPYYPTRSDGAGLTGLLNAVLKRTHKFDSKVTISDEGKDFINCCLEKSMDKRKSSKQLLSHKWWDSSQNLKWTLIRSEIIESSLGQKPTKVAQKKLKFLLSEVVNSHISKLIHTQYNFSEEKIVQSLAIFKEYILSAEKLTLYIELLKEKLDEIRRRQITIQYHKQEFQITLGEINKVGRLIAQCLKILEKEIKEGSIVNTDIGPKGELALFLVDETQSLMGCTNPSETDKKMQLFKGIANLLTLDIRPTSIELYWGQLQALSDIGTQIDKITIKSNAKQILSMINEQITPDDDVETIWTIVHNIDKDTDEKCTLEYELGKIVLSILEIPSNFNIDNGMTSEKIVLNSRDFFEAD